MSMRLLGAAVALALPIAAAAQPIAITNPSFELPVFADGGFDNGSTGWTRVGFAGTWNPRVEQYPAGVPDGAQVAWSNGGSLSQSLAAVLLPNTTYTLSYFIGRRTDLGSPGYLVELLAGATVLASDASGVAPAPGTFLPSAVLYTSPGAGPLVGQPLGIRLSAPTAQTNFDDFSLVAAGPVVIPEPATVTLVAGGLLALVGVARRRARG